MKLSMIQGKQKLGSQRMKLATQRKNHKLPLCMFMFPHCLPYHVTLLSHCQFAQVHSISCSRRLESIFNHSRLPFQFLMGQEIYVLCCSKKQFDCNSGPRVNKTLTPYGDNNIRLLAVCVLVQTPIVACADRFINK